jgi:hypothetical protein
VHFRSARVREAYLDAAGNERLHQAARAVHGIVRSWGAMRRSPHRSRAASLPERSGCL